MSYVNLGTLLDEFKINTPSDYFKLTPRYKHAFLSRVKTSVEGSANDVLAELRHTPGLKLHFQVSRLPDGGWRNIPNEIFARKIAFFASKSVITFPFDQMAAWVREDIDSLLTLLCSVRPFLEEGLVNVLSADNEIIAMSMHRPTNKYGLVSANFHLENLEIQFEEKIYPTVVANLYLPYFQPMDPKDIINIRRDEKLLYDGFEHGLSDLLNGTGALDNEEKLLSELKNIDKYVRKLTLKYEAIQEAYRRKNIYMLIGFATVGLVMLLPPIPDLAAALGSMPILDYLKFRIEESTRAKTLKEEEYYLLWRLSTLGNNSKLKKARNNRLPNHQMHPSL